MQRLHTSITFKTSPLYSTVKLYLWAAIILSVAEWIGVVPLSLGIGKVVLLPMVWALVIGAALGVMSKKLPRELGIELTLQHRSASILQIALLLFIAKLGLTVGASLPVVMAAGWAMIFQEFGHFLGTVVLGLPLALALGIKREAVGATFSVGREPSLAIISERYGLNSPEGRGVLSEYLTTAIFGALFMAVVAGFITSLGIFHPYSLAMGAGIGSGSMMGAAAAAIAAQQTPEVAKEVMALAAASNLLTTTIGTYFTLLISLPLAVWGYRVLEPILGRLSRPVITHDDNLASSTVDPVTFGRFETIGVYAVVSVLVLLANSFGQTPFSPAVLTGALVMMALACIGQAISSLCGSKVPAVCVVSLISMLATSPVNPWADAVIHVVSTINLLALITPMLTFAGLSVAKDLPVLRRLGWRIVLVSLTANFGTFIGAVLIAEFFH